MAVYQSQKCWLIRRYREQARSHRGVWYIGLLLLDGDNR